MKTNDPLLFRLQGYIQTKAKKATTKPVFVRVSSHMQKKTGDAVLISYPTIAKPKEYEVVYRKPFYEHMRSKPRALEQIASHELAHIKHPNTHNAAFRTEAERLGAGKYAKRQSD